MRKLFGTDGVRGTANIHPMTADMALRIGAAVGRYFRRDVSAGHRVVIQGAFVVPACRSPVPTNTQNRPTDHPPITWLLC